MAGLVCAWPPARPLAAGRHLASYPWLYQRGGRLPAPGEALVEVVAVGDIMLGRGVPHTLARLGDGPVLAGRNSLFLALARVAPWLRAADLALGNLECTLGEAGTARPGPHRLRAPAAAADALRVAGLDIVGLANNHALDQGPEGLAGSLALLAEAGIDTIGPRWDAHAARGRQAIGPWGSYLIRDVRGLRLAFLGFNAVPDPDGPTPGPTFDGFLAAVADAHRAADAVIVSIHWGYEYELRPDPRQEDMAAALLAAGADLVVGHHPHVVQGTALAPAGAGRIGLVAYSLGNLVFDQEQGDTRQGLALRAFFDGEGLRAVQALPLRAGPQPRLLAPGEANGLLARVVGHGEEGKWDGGEMGASAQTGGSGASGSWAQPTGAVPFPDAGREPPGRDVSFDLQIVDEGLAPATPFVSGRIDLTGDGQAEEVRLEGEQVLVYGAGGEAWRGLPTWRVVDLALGDPNDDGRAEIVLALWKPDAEGVPRSQPFVVGYRQGSYRVLWGGSPVAEPIHEVELGDLDGDGRQELVVLEEEAGGQRTVSAWRWHGWGFAQLWRSAPGPYRHLALRPGPAGGLSLITVTQE